MASIAPPNIRDDNLAEIRLHTSELFVVNFDDLQGPVDEAIVVYEVLPGNTVNSHGFGMTRGVAAEAFNRRVDELIESN